MERNQGLRGSGYRSGLQDFVRQVAEEENVPYYVLDALIQKESEYNPNARSKKGAVGLTQLMVPTAKEVGVDPYIPEENVRGGARYLANMLKRFGNMDKALVAYNAGPGRVGKPPRQAMGYSRGVLKLARQLEPWEVEGFDENPLATSLRGFTR